MKRTIMAVGAHADDIEIYFGGTLLKYHAKGYAVVYVQSTNNMSGPTRVMTPNGSFTSTSHGPVTTMAYRKAECDAAAAIFDTTPIHLDHPQRHCHNDQGEQIEVRYGCALPEGVPADVPTILTAREDSASVQRLADLILDRDPEVIFTHGFVERNPEHFTTALLVINAYQRAVEAGYRGSLVQAVNRFQKLGRFNCLWETWIDITGLIGQRMAAIQKHVSQYPPDFHAGADYWRAILEERGRVCGIGAAEAFNFINAAEPGPDDGEVLTELLQNRATPGTAWGATASLDPD